MNKKYLLAYFLLVISTVLLTLSLTKYDYKIKYKSEIAMKKVEEARKTKSKKDITEAKELIEEVINDEVKIELKQDIKSLEIEIEKDNIRNNFNIKMDSIFESLNEEELNNIKKSIETIKYNDIKEELNDRVKIIEDKIAEKKRIEEENRRKEEERKRKEEEARIAREKAHNVLVNADRKSVNSTPPSNVNVIETLTGTITAFTPYCSDGCHGYVASGKYVGDGNIHYYDKTYGEVYIVAGDPGYPLGTIVRLKNVDYFGGRDIYAIVLDRGGAIGKGRRALFDLLFALESNANNFGVRRGVTCEILRLGY